MNVGSTQRESRVCCLGNISFQEEGVHRETEIALHKQKTQRTLNPGKKENIISDLNYTSNEEEFKF
jgi:hypothetical protein